MVGNLLAKNRSESWRIAKSFIDYGAEELSEKIAQDVLNSLHIKRGSVQLQKPIQYSLFWTGLRDYCDSHKINRRDLDFIKRVKTIYLDKFAGLEQQVYEFAANHKEQSVNIRLDKTKQNYIVNDVSEQRFINNLYFTEFDLVIQTGNYLLIGEFKDTQTFGANSKHVLVHQLIRQYVSANILLGLEGSEHIEVVPLK
ncbi:hypothetical protein C1E24_14990 [Pseudoalteromonas phenolica]|uniref:Uncharacterized protein n=1 Tax=Pseudoalteromonas phenolica TaxID=161398 RepID=A0A5R9PYU3_9GAMM|nr:hypothetical protein [Pseudoalteromonas phenolica]TLX46073.1 hypothetical protein C1E24_14990 [Pseudoalteromonas phenolica]